jgi:hypothetical protein
MQTRLNFRRLGIIAAIAVGVVLALAWANGLFPPRRAGAPANALLVIAPYRHAGTWVFDDPKAGLVREPFVAGVPEMIDVLVQDIPGATNGFRLLFSARPFPGYQKKLTWLRGDMGGNYYRMESRRWRVGFARRCSVTTRLPPRNYTLKPRRRNEPPEPGEHETNGG